MSQDDWIGDGNACFTPWRFRTSKSSGIASQGTLRSILAGHQQPLHQLQCMPRVPSEIEQRRLARLDAAEHGNVHMGTRGRIRPVTHQVALQQELLNHRGQNVEADVCGFSLPGFWLRKSEPMLAQSTGELAAASYLPHFALLAHLYHGVEETSCQAERNVSSLSVLIGTSRASLRIHLRWSR